MAQQTIFNTLFASRSNPFYWKKDKKGAKRRKVPKTMFG